jgi:DNA-binding response OmpR family regulator
VEEPLRFSDLEIDPATRTVVVSGRQAELTAREFDLLLFLARHPGQVFSRDQLMDRVWQFSYYSDTTTVTVHIRRLRAKIEADASNPQWIQTVWGVGYRFRRDAR